MSNLKKVLNTIFSKLPISEEMKYKAHVAWAEYKINKEEKQDQNNEVQIKANDTVLRKYVGILWKTYARLLRVGAT